MKALPIFAIATIAIASQASIAEPVSLTAQGYLIQVNGNESTNLDKTFILNLSFDPNSAELLDSNGSTEALYRLNVGSFSMSIPDVNETFSATADGNSSYLWISVWDNYSSVLPTYVPQDRYEITFIANGANELTFTALDDGSFQPIDLSLVNSLDIPTQVANFANFGLFQVVNTNWLPGYDVDSQYVGFATSITPAPENGTASLMLSSLALFAVWSLRRSRSREF